MPSSPEGLAFPGAAGCPLRVIVALAVVVSREPVWHRHLTGGYQPRASMLPGSRTHPVATSDGSGSRGNTRQGSIDLRLIIRLARQEEIPLLLAGFAGPQLTAQGGVAQLQALLALVNLGGEDHGSIADHRA